jgi:arginyl-tRNA synthetase
MVDFDLAVVAEQSMENPVYYVQYAHARIASLVRTADERGFDHGDRGRRPRRC